MRSNPLTLRLRKDVIARRQLTFHGNLGLPRFYETDIYGLGEINYRRLRVILRSNGCSQPTCTMCPLPNQGISIGIHRVSADEYVRQVQYALERSAAPEMLCIYNDGSFFSQHELPADAREHIYQLAVRSGCRCLMVESLPGFISSTLLREARAGLGDVKLVVAIGLQSSNEHIRRLCIASPVRSDDFNAALGLLRDFNCGTKVYLLLKPPFLTEDESIGDCITSVGQLSRIGVDDVTICPLRVSQNTTVEHLYNMGLYAPPALSSIVDILRSVPSARNVRVSIFNVRSSDFDAIPPRACDECREAILKILLAYNNDRLTDLAHGSCPRCASEARQADKWLLNRTLEERVQLYFHRKAETN